MRLKAVGLDTGAPYSLEGSTNLTAWHDIATETATTNLIRFIDPEAPVKRPRFYRARR